MKVLLKQEVLSGVFTFDMIFRVVFQETTADTVCFDFRKTSDGTRQLTLLDKPKKGKLDDRRAGEIPICLSIPTQRGD